MLNRADGRIIFRFHARDVLIVPDRANEAFRNARRTRRPGLLEGLHARVWDPEPPVDVAKGDWSIVVMNADASPGVDARLSLGAKVGFLFWLGIGLAIGGGILLAVGGAMIYFSLRRPLYPVSSPAVSRA